MLRVCGNLHGSQAVWKSNPRTLAALGWPWVEQSRAYLQFPVASVLGLSLEPLSPKSRLVMDYNLIFAVSELLLCSMNLSQTLMVMVPVMMMVMRRR